MKKFIIAMMMALLGVAELVYCMINYDSMMQMLGISIFTLIVIILPILIIASFSIATEDLY